jgi:DUF1680 family protein
VGHAVRAGYLYAAMADVAALTGDRDYLRAIDSIWTNVVTRKIYVQGGLGAVGNGERFGENYELPNATAYNETCAAIANVYWNHRMFLLHGDAKYMDVLEKTLYNGLISGVGMDGKSFFYTNAMEIRHSFHHKDMEAERSGWFPCSCCPTNVTRLIPSVPGYMYAQKGKDVYVNLFIAGTATLAVDNKPVQIEQRNNYPWEGKLTMIVNPKSAQEFNLLVRIPGWAQEHAMPSNLYTFEKAASSQMSVKVNGKPVPVKLQSGYAVIGRAWKKGDQVEVDLPMDVRRVKATARIAEDQGRVALQRGPLMYCAEWPDNFGKVANIVLPQQAAFTTEFQPDLLNGVTVLRSEAIAVKVDSVANSVTSARQPFIAIPYYAWAHRGKGEMMVWLPEHLADIDIIAHEENNNTNTRK